MVKCVLVITGLLVVSWLCLMNNKRKKKRMGKLQATHEESENLKAER